MKYVILAAGQGSRFVKEGVDTPKPMVGILGRPMIERLIGVLMECGAESIYIVTNSKMDSLNNHLNYLKNEKNMPLYIRPIVSDNSFYSLSEACKGVEGKFIAMTTDAIFPTEEFKQYVKTVDNCAPDEVVMGLTEFVDDESPLYAKLSDDKKNIVDYRYGGEPFSGTVIVSAGLYGLTGDALTTATAVRYPESLSDFQRILAAETDMIVTPFVFSKAFDVDCTHDRLEAEKFVAEVNGEKQKD